MKFYFELKIGKFIESVSDLNPNKIYLNGKLVWDKNYFTIKDLNDIIKLPYNVKSARIKIDGRFGSIIKIKTLK